MPDFSEPTRTPSCKSLRLIAMLRRMQSGESWYPNRRVAGRVWPSFAARAGRTALIFGHGRNGHGKPGDAVLGSASNRARVDCSRLAYGNPAEERPERSRGARIFRKRVSRTTEDRGKG